MNDYDFHPWRHLINIRDALSQPDELKLINLVADAVEEHDLFIRVECTFTEDEPYRKTKRPPCFTVLCNKMEFTREGIKGHHKLLQLVEELIEEYSIISQS